MIELERKAERRPSPERRRVLAVRKKVLAVDRFSASLSMLSTYALYCSRRCSLYAAPYSASDSVNNPSLSSLCF